MPETSGGSQGSLDEANRERARFSRYGGLGAAGYISRDDAEQAEAFLSKPGEIAIVNPSEGALPDFEIGVAWDNVAVEKAGGFFQKFFKKNIARAGVDIDLGCLYELKKDARGAMQAFGENHGAKDQEPWIFLSGDERRGDRIGPDETIHVNGAHWNDIERILLYVYIYGGAKNWASIRPQIQVRVPGQAPMVVTLNTQKTQMTLCAVAMLENIRGGIKMTSVLEYFPGHAEMDRAFGYGLTWESGKKR